jgi:hypothetical protein
MTNIEILNYIYEKEVIFLLGCSNMEAVTTAETQVNMYQTTWYNIPK